MEFLYQFYGIYINNFHFNTNGPKNVLTPKTPLNAIIYLIVDYGMPLS